MVGGGHARLVAEPFKGVDGSLVLAGGFVVVPAFLRQGAELVMADGRSRRVAKPFVDVEGSLVVAGGLVIVPAVLGQGGRARGRWWPCRLGRRAVR